MAELKTGTTIGGTLVWTQGNFPLYPTGNTLLYKSFMIYSEFNKPQAVDNDFVSKANGGTYQAGLSILGNLAIPMQGSTENAYGGGLRRGNGDGATLETANFDIQSWNGVGIWAINGNKRTVVWNARTGHMTSAGGADFSSHVTTTLTPTAVDHLTRKDYVDGLINTTTNNANSRVLKAGDTMTGTLVTPAVELRAEAANPLHAARLSQVVVKGTVLDYGEF